MSLGHIKTLAVLAQYCIVSQRQTDRQTPTAHSRSIYRASIASHGEKQHQQHDRGDKQPVLLLSVQSQTKIHRETDIKLIVLLHKQHKIITCTSVTRSPSYMQCDRENRLKLAVITVILTKYNYKARKKEIKTCDR